MCTFCFYAIQALQLTLLLWNCRFGSTRVIECVETVVWLCDRLVLRWHCHHLCCSRVLFMLEFSELMFETLTFFCGKKAVKTHAGCYVMWSFLATYSSVLHEYGSNSTWLDSTRHIRRVEPMHFGCVELVEQHSSTRRARLARHVELDWLDTSSSTGATCNLVMITVIHLLFNKLFTD